MPSLIMALLLKLLDKDYKCKQGQEDLPDPPFSLIPLFWGSLVPLVFSVDQTNTLWRCQGGTVGLQISTALSCPLPCQNLKLDTCNSSAVFCKGEEEASTPSPKPLQEWKRNCYSVKKSRAGAVRERWGQGTLKTWNRRKRLVLILPQRMSAVIGGWLDLVPEKVKESLYGSVKKELSERIQLMPLTELMGPISKLSNKPDFCALMRLRIWLTKETL